MANLTTQGKYMIGILRKIKEYPEYKKHLPIITSGIDVYSGYDDFYLLYDDYKVADVLFIKMVMPLPGSMGNLDHTLIILDPDNITITYDKSYYDFSPAEISSVETTGLDVTSLYRTLMRTMEYGCLHWAVPFRRYAFRINNSLYDSEIISVDCINEDAFFLQGNIFTPESVRPISVGTMATPYDDIKALYIPLIHLRAIGSQLGIYPDAVLESLDDLLHSRNIFTVPSRWLTARERRNGLVPPYSSGQIVYEQNKIKSYISLINNNIEDLDNAKAWKEIDYSRPYDISILPPELNNPVEALLSLFNKAFDLTTITPEE